MRAKGDGSITKTGYHRFKLGRGVQKMAHVLIAERALGRPLPPGAQVHHMNENKGDNRNENLVICPSASYHRLIHQRMAAHAACGNANWRICKYCKTYDAPENLYTKNDVFHAICHRGYERKRNGVTRPIIVPEMGNKIKCSYCKQYDEPERVRVTKYNKYHPVCRAAYSKARNERIRLGA